MQTNANFERNPRKPVSARRCPRCGEVHEFLVHGYCLGCNAELRAEQDLAEHALKLAWGRSIAEQDIHDELCRH